jgi:hypothetical protein
MAGRPAGGGGKVEQLLVFFQILPKYVYNGNNKQLDISI